MALCVPDQAEQTMLSLVINKTDVYTQQNLKLKLYKAHSGGNTTDPDDTATEASFTVADFTGYADITLTGNSWSISGNEASYAQQTFTSTAGSQNQSIYGYYMVQTTSGKIMWAERFSDGPYVIVNNGDLIKVTPKITLS